MGWKVGPTVGAEDGLALGSGVGELAVVNVRSRLALVAATALLKVTLEPDTDTTVVPSAMKPVVKEVTLASTAMVEATLLDETTTSDEPEVVWTVAMTTMTDE